MSRLIIVIASQDFEGANHRGLWIALTKYAEVLVINIPADYITSRVTGKAYRINDAKSGVRHITDRLSVFRPLFFVRPEILPDCFFPMVARSFWKQVREAVPDFDNRRIDVLVYDGRWIKILKNSNSDIRLAYYLFDEVRKNGNDNSIDQKRLRYDDYACRFSDVIFTMTAVLAESRCDYLTPKIVIGNGADKPTTDNSMPQNRIMKSAAFVGNFRDWIDKELLSALIKSRKDVLFCFVGPVAENMRSYFDSLLNENTNTAYFGKVSKDEMQTIYRMFDCVIIPYKDNEFIKATRPIKIVEAVMSGTPVVTVPMNGYDESPFIRFARTADEFSSQLDVVFATDLIADNFEEHKRFLYENSWEKKADLIFQALCDQRRHT